MGQSGNGLEWSGWEYKYNIYSIYNQATTLYHVGDHMKSAHFEIMISCLKLQNVCHTLDAVDVAALWVECALKMMVSINFNRVLRQL